MENDERVKELFVELERLCQQDEYKRILNTCDKILNILPNDNDALKTKIITHIQLGNYEQVIKIVSKTENPSEFCFENSYALYRSNSLDEALDQIEENLSKENINEESYNQSLQLKAQILYRMERNQEALNVYKEILEKTSEDDPYYYEILSNYYAVKSAFKFNDNITIIEDDISENNFETYELTYNSACICIAEGRLDEAEKLLEKARDICREALIEEDYAEVEIEEELAIIIVQLAYVNQLKKNESKAYDLYQGVLKSKAADEVVTAIASNNVISIKKENELFDSAKKYRAATSANLKNKLTRAQKKSIEINGALLSFFMNKYSTAIEQADSLLEKYPDDDNLLLIKPAVFYRQKNVIKAIEELEKSYKSNKTSIKLCLTIAQLKIIQGKYNEAIEVIEKCLKCLNEDISTYPGLLSLNLWLNEKCGNIEKSMNLLQTCINNTNKSSITKNSTLLRKLADFKLHCNKPEEASKDYEKLVKADPTDVEAISGLVTSLSKFDITKAEEYEKFLPSSNMDEVTKNLNIDVLESSFASTKTYKKLVNQIGNNDRPRVKKPRKRKPFVPKKFDPNYKPDPERWIPKRDRSTFKKGRKNLNKGPQGASVVGGGIGGTRSANIGGGKFVPLVEKPAEVTTPEEKKEETKPKQNPKPKKNQKKKKGKGKKW